MSQNVAERSKPQAPSDCIRPERLESLLKISLRLTAERDLNRLLHLIIEETTSVMDAERSSLFLIDAGTREMWAKIAQGVNTEEIRFPLGMGIAGTVGQTGEVINISNAYQDPRFNPAFDRKTGFLTKSTLCVPLKNMRGEIIGAIQVLNKRTGVFSVNDEALLAALASHAAVAIENADLYKRLSLLNLSLEEQVSKRTADLLAANERLSLLNQELEHLSITDSLTQTHNRRYFMERLSQEVKRAHRYGSSVSLLMFDIDHFKTVNDSYGHMAGDVVLAELALNIKKKLRETDLLARYGGEEFALIATPIDHQKALKLAERIRTFVETHVFTHDMHQIKVTVSIGVSSWHAPIKDNFEKMILEADSALYGAKKAGRNRVCC
jgi:diguanylate cyclase (GGDEF)-like protein